MNRPVEFRGIKSKYGTWVYGWYMKQWISPNAEKDVICTRDGDYEVEQGTIGEFAGAGDIHNKHIFEHDIVRVGYRKATGRMVWWHTGEVIFEHGTFCVGKTPIYTLGADALYEILGDVFENKEKREGANEKSNQEKGSRHHAEGDRQTDRPEAGTVIRAHDIVGQAARPCASGRPGGAPNAMPADGT